MAGVRNPKLVTDATMHRNLIRHASIHSFQSPIIHRQLSRVYWLHTVFTGNRACAEEGDSGEAVPVGEGPRSGRPALASSSSDSTCTKPEL